MAMNKKEKEEFEAALTASALRSTCEVLPDVPPPNSYTSTLSKGWAAIAISSDSARVEPACSSQTSHGIGSQDKTSSQRPISLYSSKLNALKALRYCVEKDCARRLRKIDRMIEEEQVKSK